jgi:thiamine-phosphate pyrophosphorylase
MTIRELAAFTRKVLSLGTGHTKILVNDRADVAIACGADGVHFRDGAPRFRSNLITSAAIHHPNQAAHTRADYLLLAPIFAPLSKAMTAKPLGVEAIREAAKLTSIPILALGGISESNASQCLEAGAAGIAAISYFSKARA